MYADGYSRLSEHSTATAFEPVSLLCMSVLSVLRRVCARRSAAQLAHLHSHAVGTDVGREAIVAFTTDEGRSEI